MKERNLTTFSGWVWVGGRLPRTTRRQSSCSTRASSAAATRRDTSPVRKLAFIAFYIFIFFPFHFQVLLIDAKFSPLWKRCNIFLIFSSCRNLISNTLPTPQRFRSGSALILFSWFRIRIGNADQDPGAMKLTKFNK
jgi:hypothetical protein